MSATNCLPGEQWLYTGQLDDMVGAYPWPGIKRTGADLDRWLFLNLVLGKRPLINDGYLILNRDCLKSLQAENSQLNCLLRQGYARVLSRTPKASFVDVVEGGAREGIETYGAIVRNRKRWSKLKRELAGIDAELNGSPAHVPWPNLNISAIYARLVEDLGGMKAQQIGLDLDEAHWRGFAEQFMESFTKSPGPARDRWEKLARRLQPKKRSIAALMHLGNEIYHYSFGVGLTARTPPALGDAEVAVQTRWSPGLSSLGESSGLENRAHPEDLEVRLRKGVPYGNGSLSYALLSPDSAVGAARAAYLNQRRLLDAGSGDLKDAKEATARYQAKLDAYLGFNATRTTAFRVCNATLCTTAVMIAAIPAVVKMGLPASAAVALMTYAGTDFVVPHVIRRWSLDLKAEKAWRRIVGKRSKVERLIDRKQALTSLVLHRQVARDLTIAIPSFTTVR